MKLDNGIGNMYKLILSRFQVVHCGVFGVEFQVYYRGA
jgi:hypothetical protein